MIAMAPPSRQCPRCASPLAADARFCPSCGFAASRLVPGQVLDGKYEILDKIGEGGMGEVYRARHLHLDEIRIIKVTKPDAAGEGDQPRRFQEEARLATLVRHPNVAALYDFSRQPDGSFYMVWEFIDGVTLEAWLRRHGRLPVARALDVARQVLAGLEEIHAQGIVHRDISPDNIMLRELPGGRLQAKIIDLGIAKRVAAESLHMTGTGLFLGKLKYCSPEQAGALPPGQTLDQRTDIYSFGVVLYEMLSGRAPFESSTPEGYIGKHLHTPPPPLDVAGLPRQVGPALAATVARALDKKRERRFASARELSEALGRLAPAAEDAETSPTEPAPKSAANAGPRRILVPSALVLVLVAAAVLLVQRGRGPRSNVPAGARPATATPAPARGPEDTPSLDEALALAPTAIAGAFRDSGIPRPPAVSAAPPGVAPPGGAEAKPASPAPAEARRRIALWKALPGEARARRAADVVRMVNRFVDDSPDDPLSAELEKTLPSFLKAEASAALDHAQPLVGLLYFRAYEQLDFAPDDPGLESRFENVRPPKDGRPERRKTPTPPPSAP